MPGVSSLRKWYLLHKWSSLICTFFLLVICLTGLPLVFIDEISEWWRGDPPTVSLPADTPMANIDEMVLTAKGPKGSFPGETVRWMSFEDDRPEVWIGLAPSYEADRKKDHVVRLDARTGKVLRALKSGEHTSPLFIGLMFKLHTDLFVGLYGELFLGAMGLLFVIATVSGVMLYSPFMKKLNFGTIREGRASRLKWLDLHNLIGIVTLVWVLVMGITGVLNDLSVPLYEVWRKTELNTHMQQYQHKPMPEQLTSAQAAYDTVSKAIPNKSIRSIRFPDGEQGSAHHYMVWTKGATPLTSRLFMPVLVDARTGVLTSVISLPWYLVALQTSRPLHFGDYGGLPLKIIWVLLDLATIAILISGLYLWFARRKATENRIAELERQHAIPAAIETESA